MFKKKVVKKKVAKVEKKVEKKPPKGYETTERNIVQHLQGLGFTITDVKSPIGERTEKLYVFAESEATAKKALEGME